MSGRLARLLEEAAIDYAIHAVVPQVVEFIGQRILEAEVAA